MPLASYCIIRLMYQLSYSLFAFVFLEGCFFFFFLSMHTNKVHRVQKMSFLMNFCRVLLEKGLMPLTQLL